MPRNGFTLEQIIGFWKVNAARASVRGLCRVRIQRADPLLLENEAQRHGCIRSEPSQGAREQNRRLKQLVGDMTLDNQALRKRVARWRG